MKNIVFCFLVLVSVGLSITSCGNKAKSKTDQSEVVDKTGKEYASAYVCPMHCKGSGSDKAGKCPVCKMDYVANKDHKAKTHDHSGHNHDHHNHDGHDHDGHDHDGHDHEGHNHDGHDHGSHDGHNH